MTKISLNWNNVHSFGRVQYERPYRLQRTIRLERTGRYGRWIRGCITKRFTVSHINGGRIPQLERGRFRMGKNIPQSWLLQLPHLVVSAESFTLVDFHLSICLPPMFLGFFSVFCGLLRSFLLRHSIPHASHYSQSELQSQKNVGYAHR